jgi:hypothetical protein
MRYDWNMVVGILEMCQDLHKLMELVLMLTEKYLEDEISSMFIPTV